MTDSEPFDEVEQAIADHEADYDHEMDMRMEERRDDAREGYDRD